jgi:hypothetical protein
MEVLLEIFFEAPCDEETTLSVAVCNWEYGIVGPGPLDKLRMRPDIIDAKQESPTAKTKSLIDELIQISE